MLVSVERDGATEVKGRPPDTAEAVIFDAFPWWDQRDVLTYVTPARFSYIASVAGDLHGRRVLDLGCGGGLLAEPLARAGAEVTGVDISDNALRIARQHAERHRLDIDYRLAPAEDLPFPDGSFDVVVAFDVLEHVTDLQRAVQEAARVLRPGGKLIYDTMNRTWLCRVMVIWFGEHLWPGGPPPGTHRWDKFIRPAELRALLAGGGVNNVETVGFVPVGIDLQGRLVMGYSRCLVLSYLGYGVKRGA